MAAVAQPSGTVTLVFTDIEGSTRLLDGLGVDAYRDALEQHRRVVRESCARHSGYEVDCEGDAFFVAFHTAPAAVAAVSEAMQGLEGGPIRIRVGIHTGEPGLDGPNYVGMDIHRAARIMAAAHGGQVLVSAATAALVGGRLRDLGYHRLKDPRAGAPVSTRSGRARDDGSGRRRRGRIRRSRCRVARAGARRVRGPRRRVLPGDHARNLASVEGMRWPLEPVDARRLADVSRESVVDARRRGLVADEIASYDELSHALLAAGERDEAWSVAVYAIQLLRERQVGWDCLLRIGATLARCAASFGDARQAFVLAGAVRSASTELRHTLVPARAAAVEAGEIEARGSLDERAAARATADGEATSVESLLAYLGTLEAARPLGRRPGRLEDWVVGQSDQSDPVPRIDRPRYRRYLDDMNEDEVPEPFTVPVPPGFPPPHGGDRVLFYRTHETAGGPGGKDHEDIMLRRVPREIAMRYRAAAGGRAMTHAQYLTALVELHARIRERADAGDETARAVLDELGLQTVAV